MKESSMTSRDSFETSEEKDCSLSSSSSLSSSPLQQTSKKSF